MLRGFRSVLWVGRSQGSLPIPGMKVSGKQPAQDCGDQSQERVTNPHEVLGCAAGGPNRALPVMIKSPKTNLLSVVTRFPCGEKAIDAELTD